MVYTVDVLDSTGRRTAELSGLISGRLSEKINSPSILTVETIERSEWESFIPGKGFLRLRDPNGDKAGIFRIIETEISRKGSKTVLSAIAKHILYDTADEIFADSVTCINYTPQELSELVLGYSRFGVGTVEPTTVIPFVRFDYEPVLNCLLRICSLTGAEIDLDEDSGVISIVESIGSDNGLCFRFGLNLRGVTRKTGVSRLANRVYGVGGGYPPLLLTGATQSGGLDYVEDENSVEQWGLHESVYSDPALEDVENLVMTPALDGVYTDGLCENWEKTGNPVVSRCDDLNYCLYGRVSQRVQCSDAGQGIHQHVSVEPGEIYSLSANLFLISGAVRVQAEESGAVYKKASPSNGAGFVTVNIEDWKAISSTVTVNIKSESAADFYVDSVQLLKGTQAKEFTVGKSADNLWERSREFLNSRKEPEIAYNIDIAGFYGEKREFSEADGYGFGLGDTVRVVDTGMGIDVKTRVAEREVDILKPWRMKAGLESPGRSAADVFAALRDAYEEGISHQRAILARSAKAGEAGASRIGFSNESFRYEGILSTTAWNSISWSSGTLKVGEGWFPIGQGSANGLAESSTYYFYFDRTESSAFGWTTVISNAEGEDKIIVFAVRTTVLPELCTIYPMGMIHD